MRKDERAQILENNLLTAAQVCEMLDISKSYFYRLIKEEQLPVAFHSSQGILVFNDKVEEYQKRRTKAVKAASVSQANPLAVLPKTRFAADEFLPVITQMGRIERIFIYFDDLDAVMDGFYQPRQNTWGMKSADAKLVRIPRVVLIDEHGQQLWSMCGTAGYRGAGPNHSARLLRWLSHNTAMYSMEESTIEQLYQHRVIQYQWDKGEWVIHTKPSLSQPEPNHHSYELYPDTKLVQYQNKLVMLQVDPEHAREQLAQSMVERYKAFIPDPIGYRYDDSEQAPVNPMTAQKYSLMLQDRSGRELWLTLESTVNPAERKQTVKDILEIAGLELDAAEVTTHPLTAWLSNMVSRIKGEGR